MIVASALDFVALGFAAQSLIATLASCSLVFNIMFAQFYLGEVVTVTDWKATMFIFCGCVLAVAFGQHGTEVYTLSGLMNLYKSTGFIIYAVIVIVVMGTLFGLIRYIEVYTNTILELRFCLFYHLSNFNFITSMISSEITASIA